MIDVAKPRDGCLYEIRQKGQKDPCYVVVPDTYVRLGLYAFYYAVGKQFRDKSSQFNIAVKRLRIQYFE